MPTINGVTMTSVAQINRLTNAQIANVAPTIGVPRAFNLRPSEVNSIDFRGIRNHTNAVAKRRIALKFGLRKSADKASDIIKKAFKKKKAKTAVSEKIATKSWKDLYAMAKRAKRESDRHCVPSGLRRMSKVELTQYIKQTRKK